MKLLIRVDGYHKIGLGHIYRTIALAIYLKDHEILFVSNKKHKLGIKLIEEHQFNLKIFSTNEECDEIITNFKPDIIINDILDTNIDYIEYFKKKKIFIVNFEDLGEGAKKADLIINALYEQENYNKNYYSGKDYYILREEFQQIGQKRVKKEVTRILITFGGTDPNNYTERVLNIINDLKIKKINVSVVLGLGYKNYSQLKKRAENLEFNLTLKQNVKNISKYMYEADIIFTSAGRTIYEIVSIGTPTIVLAQNERELLHTFANGKNGIINLGLGYKISNEIIKENLIKLINDFDLRKKLNQGMLKNDLTRGIKNVINLILNEYEEFQQRLIK